MTKKISPASRGISPVEGSDVTGLLEEMIDLLVANSGFDHVKMAGEAPINRTTEPVVRFLLWLKRTPEAQAALRLALKRLRDKPHCI
jgi:hypothetical protein